MTKLLVAVSGEERESDGESKREEIRSQSERRADWGRCTAEW